MVKFVALVALLVSSLLVASVAEAQVRPVPVQVQLDERIFGQCRQGWTVSTWDADSRVVVFHAVANQAHPTFEVELDRLWDGEFNTRVSCGRRRHEWSSTERTPRVAGFRSILINGIEFAQQRRPALSFQTISTEVFSVVMNWTVASR